MIGPAGLRTPQEAIPRLEEAITVARLVGARAEEAFALDTLASCLDGPDDTLELAGRDQYALVNAGEGYQRAHQLGLEHAVGSYVAWHLAWQLLAAGRWAECERLTSEVLTADSWDAFDLHAVRSQLLARRGDFAAAHEQLDQARQASRAADRDPAWQAWAELALWEGNHQAAA